MKKSTHKLWIALALVVALAVVLIPRRVHMPTVPSGDGVAPAEPAAWSLDGVVESVVLVGDAGDALPAVWEPLSKHLKLFPAATTVVLLGDNVYNEGIPPEDHPNYPDATRRLNYLIDQLKGAGVRSVFIPGNHDWNADQPGGLRAIERQEELVRKALGVESFVPSRGCPGPATVQTGDRFHVVAIDSEWWLNLSERPPLDGAACPQSSQSELLRDIQTSIESGAPGALRILAMHHPLMSYGPHAEGSQCPHDFGCEQNAEYRTQLFGALRKTTGTICVAGHDHSLQVLKGRDGCDLFLVSGATSHLSWTKVGPETIYASELHGFIRIDALKQGGWKLTVFTINLKDGELTPSFSKLLEGRRS